MLFINRLKSEELQEIRKISLSEGNNLLFHFLVNILRISIILLLITLFHKMRSLFRFLPIEFVLLYLLILVNHFQSPY